MKKGAEAFVFGAVEEDVGVGQGGFFRAGEFTGDQVRDLGEFVFVIEVDEVGFDLTGAHEVDAGQQYAIDVEQGFDAAGGFFVEELPLGFGKAEIVMGVVAGDAGVADLF